MKKRLLIALFSPLAFLLGGCQGYLEDPAKALTKQISDRNMEISPEEKNTPTPTPSQPARTTIDELSGTLLAFDGSQILVELEDGSVYAFPVENASLECSQGMIAGNPIVIIYEGECDLDQPESLNILKVADPVEFEKPRTRTAVGTVTGLTVNTLSIRTEKGANLRFSTTGAKQYYSQGIKKGTSVYVHFQGKFHKNSDGTLNTSNVKVLDISDLTEIPEPTPTPTPDPYLDEKDQIKYLTGYITGVRNYVLSLRPSGASKSIRVNLQQITSRFPYGLQVGSRVTISYTGTIEGTSLKKAQLLSAVGENLLRLPSSQQYASVSGTVQAQTANTITLRTKDKATLVADISGIEDFPFEDLQTGDSVTILYNPVKSTSSSTYTAMEIRIDETV